MHSRLPTAVPGISSTCRQIRAEGLPIFVAENTGFRFDGRLVASRCVANWLRALGVYARSIKVLELEVHVYERGGWRESGMRTIKLTRSNFVILSKLDETLHVDGIEMEIAKEIREKAGQQCKKVEGHVEELNERMLPCDGLQVEEAMYEVVGSDLMADLVWKCAK